MPGAAHQHKMAKQSNQELHKSKIGGQALIEGIMMKGPLKGAMACRLPDGSIDLEVWDEKNGKNPPWYRKTPLVRGCINFVLSLKDGYRCLMKSAEKQTDFEEANGEESPEEMSKFETWLNDHLGEKMMGFVMVLSLIFSVALMLGLFLYLPRLTVSLIKPLTANRIIRSIAEGVVKILLFVGYMAVTALMKSIKTTYEYHGAEHKTIACYEAHLPLTVENIRKQVRFHPRCGTSFIFVVLIIGIFVGCFIPFTVVWQRMLCSLLLLPCGRDFL